MHRIQSILPPLSPRPQHPHSDPQAGLATSCSAHCIKRRPGRSANGPARAPCTPPGTCTLRLPQTRPPRLHHILSCHAQTWLPAPPYPPGVQTDLTSRPSAFTSWSRDQVQPGSDTEQELHSQKSTLPANKREGKNPIRVHLTVKKKHWQTS